MHGGSAHALEEENRRLRSYIAALEEKLGAGLPQGTPAEATAAPPSPYSPLTNDAVARYSRQLLLPEIGTEGMKRLLNSSVLLVGAGGLASTAAPYLAGAGVGRLGIVDFDDVEMSNLHRQVMHTELRCGRPKVDSAKLTCLAVNPTVQVEAIKERFTAENGMALVEGYDVVIDCTDNVTARYLVNDACVLAKKPLVSGSALRWEGQLSVYGLDGSPCYRCAYPTPPPLETVTSCADGGVVGAVPGVIGCLQAIEAIKVLLSRDGTMAGKLLLFNALRGSFLTMKHRPRDPSCAVCGTSPTIISLTSYDAYLCKPCEAKPCPLPDGAAITVQEFQELLAAKAPLTVVDVRPATEFAICSLPEAKNIPLPKLRDRLSEVASYAAEGTVVVVCRRGIASAEATRVLLDAGVKVVNLTGGVTRYAREVDPSFPQY